MLFICLYTSCISYILSDCFYTSISFCKRSELLLIHLLIHMLHLIYRLLDCSYTLISFCKGSELFVIHILIHVLDLLYRLSDCSYTSIFFCKGSELFVVTSLVFLFLSLPFLTSFLLCLLPLFPLKLLWQVIIMA